MATTNAPPAAPALDLRFDRLARRVRRCLHCSSMNHVHVLGPANGPLDAEVLFVAEAPGRLGAARTGIPMTSDVTGRRFHAFLARAAIPRDRVFITNSVLCNPLTPAGNNRRPASREVAACSEFLAAQLRLVAAPLVVAMGGVALAALARVAPHEAVLARDAGRAFDWPGGGVPGRRLVPLYHPSIQSTLSRPHEEQLDDWRRLGELYRARNASQAGLESPADDAEPGKARLHALQG